MKYILLIVGCFFLYNIFNVVRRTFQGTRFWSCCEIHYQNLLRQGYTPKEALLEISKQKHPELSKQVHERIVDKFSEINQLANFIYNALDFKPSTSPTYGRKLTDDHALAILESTTVTGNGLVNTDFSAVEEYLSDVSPQKSDLLREEIYGRKN